jgi:hypothetical protein
MKKVKEALAAVITGISIIVSGPSSAITAGELLEDNSSSEIYNYLAGLADMFAYIQFTEGNKERGNCVYNWYYRTEGSVEKVYGYLEKFPDKAPEGIFWVLAKRACPPPEEGR